MPEIKYNLEIESKQGKTGVPAAHLFSMLSDFNNIKRSLPPEQKNNFYCTKDTCLLPLGRLKPIPVKITSREVNKQIKYMNDGGKIKFSAWIQIKSVRHNDTRIKLTVKIKLNFILRMFLKKQLQKAADSFIDSLCVPATVQQRRH